MSRLFRTTLILCLWASAASGQTTIGFDAVEGRTSVVGYSEGGIVFDDESNFAAPIALDTGGVPSNGTPFLSSCGICLPSLEAEEGGLFDLLSVSLGEFLFAEDVQISSVTETFHHVGVHGPQAPALIAAAAGDESPATLPDLQARAVEIGGIEVFVVRRDQTGGPGFELIMPRNDAVTVWETLLAAGETISGQGRSRMRPIGWHAFNVARIEAGTPLYNIDFGPDNLPHETGLVSRRVSFTKGCYLGQEIVARTENLGRAKQELVGVRPARDL